MLRVAPAAVRLLLLLIASDIGGRVVLPLQMLMTVIARLGAPLGSSMPIAILFFYYRLWSRMG